MDDEVEIIYNKIIEKLNEEEKKYCNYLLYTENGFIKYGKAYKKDTLSLQIKLKSNRKDIFFNILDELNINYKISNEDKYYMLIELKQNKNYILVDYVVNSHITIPNSFLDSFGYKTQNGQMIDFINIKKKQIESKKTKEYGSEYGYYSKIIEDILNTEFEKRIGEIRSKIYAFRNKKIDKINLTSQEVEDIYNFFDITTYRNVDILNQVNQKSISSVLLGGYTHDQLMHFILGRKFPHIYKGLKLNFIINKTKRNFIINDTLISGFYCDNKNEIIILPVNNKVCLALMDAKYHKKYVINGELYFMNMEKDEDVEMINKYIYERAKQNGENVIGNKEELKILLQYENNGGK